MWGKTSTYHRAISAACFYSCAACFLPAFIACQLSLSEPSFNSVFLPLLQSTPTRSFVALACLGERLTGSDTQASPEHTLHVPLPAFRCTPPCATCHPQQISAPQHLRQARRASLAPSPVTSSLKLHCFPYLPPIIKETYWLRHQASPEHLLHVPLPAYNCTSTPCTTCRPQQRRDACSFYLCCNIILSTRADRTARHAKDALGVSRMLNPISSLVLISRIPINIQQCLERVLGTDHQ